MPFHLRYSESPADEFRTPDGEWLYTLRAITFDNWLLWRHALPEDQQSWHLLDRPAYCNIQRLAKLIHSVHEQFSNYKRLEDTPFSVSCWWDPFDDSGQWVRGDRVLLRIKGYTALEAQREIPPRLKNSLLAQPRSLHWIEFGLPVDPLSQRDCDNP